MQLLMNDSIPGIASTVAMMDGIHRHTESRLNLGMGLKILTHLNRYIHMRIGDSVQFSQYCRHVISEHDVGCSDRTVERRMRNLGVSSG